MTDLNYLDLSSNNITFLPERVFDQLTNLQYLLLQNNKITSISNKTFAKTTNLLLLFLSANKLDRLPRRSFININPQVLKRVYKPHILMFSDNPIKVIEPEVFIWTSYRSGMQIYLLRTKLKKLSFESFIFHTVPKPTKKPMTLNLESSTGDAIHDIQVVLQNRTIAKVICLTSSRPVTIHLNPINSPKEAIGLEGEDSTILMFALLASGFTRINDSPSPSAITLLPCPVGTFSNAFTARAGECTKCPPGGFYSDDVGYVGRSCKKCPNGSFVSFDTAPGTRTQDCKSCPEGTESDFFAGYRACQCLEEFYRTHMFEKCLKCVRGLKCQDDHVSLKSGYWWEWRNKTRKDRYRDFIANLMTSPPALDAESVRYPFPIPTPYRCSVEDSCKGGLDSPCENGYEGPLCEVCSAGYYKQLQTCIKCPSKKWIIGQLSIIAAIAFILIAVLVLSSKRNKGKGEKHSLIDMFFSKLKIIIGFYQVTHGLIQAFSYVKWPGSLQVIAKYSEILQMDVLQVAPIRCLSSRLHVNAFGSLLAIVAINAAVIGVSFVTYEVRKLIILQSRGLQYNDKLRKISQTKELIFRNMCFFLYVTYLSTCARTANVLPIACHKLCRDEKEELCYKYMKADYSIQCQGTNYNHWLIIAYISTAYIVVLPASSFITLWRKRRALLTTIDADAGSGMEIMSGLRFLFENYKHRAWYWELVETSRKVILTSGLILVGQESRSYIGLAWVIAGMYGMLFSWIKPIQDVTENRLMATSIAVTVVNLGIGAVSRIPAENIASSTATYMDAVLFKILVLGANTSVIGLLVVQYAMFLYRYFKEWRKNPHWSLSCCLGLLLPLNDLQGEIHGLVDADILKNQLQTGQFEQPTIVSAVKDSGAIDVTLEDGEQRDGSTVVIKDMNCEHAIHSETRLHQGTQTELYGIPMTASVAHGQMSSLHEESLPQQSIPAERDTVNDNIGSSTEKRAEKGEVKRFPTTSTRSKKHEDTED
ncbi:uncharacterized protein LOC144660438 [Oculina patagonica]